MKIIRVFPRKTNATPDDELAYYDGPGMFPPDADEVHISVAFTWDLPRAEDLARQWRYVAPVHVGGPGIGDRGFEFEPGKYIKNGYVITSRGCNNHCWFCSVWRRDGAIRELPIKDGWNVLDDNLMACSDAHITSVFEMLKRQPRRPEFTGGLEAKLLKQWHVDQLRELKPKQIFFAYDDPGDLEPLRHAGKMLMSSGFTMSSHVLRAYCLCGYPGDTFDNAEMRFMDCIRAGFMPMAMLYRDKTGMRDELWAKFQRSWARPAIIATKLHEFEVNL